MPGGIQGLASYLGAWFSVQAHGEDATPEHAQNLVFEGRRYTPEEFARAFVSTERGGHADGLAALTDDQVADALLVKLEHGRGDVADG